MMDNTKVLIVDDEYHITRVMTFMLRREGLDCYTASDGEEALSLLDREQFLIIFLDVNMPEMSGIEVCRRIRCHPLQSEAYVIFVSACTQDRINEIGIEAGANDFITKPFDPDVILSKVRDITGTPS